MDEYDECRGLNVYQFIAKQVWLFFFFVGT